MIGLNLNINNLLKILISASLGIVLISNLDAQQDMFYTNYNYSQLAFNPAFAGHRNNLSLTGMSRKQWIGFENPPTTFLFLAHTSIYDNLSDCRIYSRENKKGELVPQRNNQVGIGLMFFNDKIGVQSTNLVRMSYSYKIKFSSKKKISFGLQASVLNFKQQFTKLDDLGTNDPIFDKDVYLNRFNFGSGVMYESDLFFIGASIPDIMENRTGKEETAEVILGRQYFLIGGYTFYFNRFVAFKPSVMLRYIEKNPMLFDINANLIFNDMILLGVSYRYCNSVNAIFEVFLSDELRVGFSFDYATEQIRKASYGSVELILNYTIITCEKRIVNPRFL